MTQHLRALVALAEEPGSISSTHIAAHDLSGTPVPRHPAPSSGLQIPGSHDV